MGTQARSHTSVSLLGRLRESPSDQEAWAEFVVRYGPRIFTWCRAWNLQEADAHDVAQTVLAKLVERMTTFAYDGQRSFRAYLKTLTHYALCDALNLRKEPGGGQGGSEVLQALETVEARDDLVRRLEDQFDHELMEEAMRRVSARVEERTWQAFQLLSFDGLAGAEVAERLGMKSSAVFVAKSKVLRMLREEIAGLEQG